MGGFFGVVLILGGVLYWLRHRKPEAVPESPTTTDGSGFFRYDPGPVRVRRPSEAFAAAKALEGSLPMRTLSPDSTTVPLVPNRRRSMPCVDGTAGEHAHELGRQASVQSDLATGTGSEGTAPGTVNMQALANEVAAVLMRAPSGQTLNAGVALGMLTDPAEGQYHHSHARLGSLASHNSHDPPAYQVARGPSMRDISGLKDQHDR